MGRMVVLPIFDVAVSGFGRAIRSLPRLLAIYWLPWLLGTIALLTLEVVVQDHLRLGWAPGWARNIVWAPFAAVAYLTLLRWVLDGEPPARAINFEVGRKTLVSAPIVAAWFLANAMVDAAPVPMLRWLVIPQDVVGYQWENLETYAYAFMFAGWLVNGVLFAWFFGLVVVVDRCGWPDLHVHWSLLRQQPVRLVCISLLAAATVGGAWRLGSQAIAWFGLDQLAPQSIVPWRAYVLRAFTAELPYLPLQFLEFAIQGCILAEAYRRLVLAKAGQ
jgi:hypothetical protein